MRATKKLKFRKKNHKNFETGSCVNKLHLLVYVHMLVVKTN